MGRNNDKQIRVSGETWMRLNSRKRPGDSFDEVIRRLLDDADGED